MILLHFTSSCLICSGWSLSKLILFWNAGHAVWQQLTKKAHQEPMSFLVTRSNVPHRPIKTKSARFSTGRDKQCKGRTKHGRKERIHACHHWVGRTGQRTIGWRRLSERWNWNESAQLTTQDSGIQNATKAQRIVEFSAAHRARNTLAARIWFPFFLEK